MLIRWKCECGKDNWLDYDPCISINTEERTTDDDCITDDCAECGEEQDIGIKVEIKLIER